MHWYGGPTVLNRPAPAPVFFFHASLAFSPPSFGTHHSWRPRSRSSPPGGWHRQHREHRNGQTGAEPLCSSVGPSVLIRVPRRELDGCRVFF